MIKRILVSLSLLVGAFVVIYFNYPQPAKKVKPKYDLTTSEGLKKYFFAKKVEKKTKPKFDKPDKAMLEEIALRSEVGKPIAYKGSWRFEAQKVARKLPNTLQKTTALDWVERGPGNVGGRTRAIVIHPTNTSTWWAGAVGGGIWKTTDGGLSWDCKTDNMPIISITCMAICESNPNILYAGTGEGFYNSDAIIGDGLFLSTDGGETWQQVASTVSNSDFRYVNRIIVNPDNASNLVVATNSGVFVSQDGGSSWSQTFNNGQRVQHIIANPERFSTQFIGVDGSGIYKSTNGGWNWNFVSEEFTAEGRIELAIAPTDTNIVYAAPVNSSYGLQGFFRSDDAGDSWTDYGNSTNWLGGQGWYDNALIVSPLDANYVFAGGINIYRIRINGTSMTATQMTEWYTGTSNPYVHADQHTFATVVTSPTNFEIIVGNDGGVHYSPDMGSSWQEMNNYYNVTQYYDADRHPTANQFIGGTQDNGTHRSPLNPDYTSGWSSVIGGDGFDCAWNKEDPSVVYGTLYSTRIYKSTNGGSSFFSTNNGMPESGLFHTPLAMDPNNSDVLFTAGDNNTVYRTDDAANNWSSTTIANNGYTRYKLAVSEANSNIVWAGGTTIYINVSEDGGISFTQVNQPSSSPHAWLTGISTHPVKDSTAFLTIGSSGSGKIYRTRDLGQNWENINNNLPDVPVYTVLVMPFDTTEIWIGTDIGLFISNDNGASWNYSDEGLPAVSIRRLKIVEQEIVATTHGRGIWSVHRDELAYGPLLAPALYDLTVPNPNTGELKIRFLASSQYDSVQVVVNGSVVDRLQNVAVSSDTFGIYHTSAPEEVQAQLVAYRGAENVSSEQKSVTVFASSELIDEDFDDLQSSFFGDLSIGTPSGFSTPLLQSAHPYSDGQTLISYLGPPIQIKSGSMLNYSDVAIVEPGESGSVYGDEDFWDYVAVEGSDDGDIWVLLNEPYDCRFDGVWQSAYDAGSDGSEIMLRDHPVDLTSFFETETNAFIRFRLYADANTTGWGWAIDDITVTNSVSAIKEESGLIKTYALEQNYPNPFNPLTTITYQLPQNTNVELKIFNALGQTISTLVYEQQAAGRYKISFNGTNLASGIYYYQLKSGNFSSIKKMVLVK